MSELPTLHVGDHVADREDPDATMLVVGLDTLRADAYVVEGEGSTAATVADYNEDYPESDDVVEVVFPSRTDMDLGDKRRYAYPRSRLERIAPVHTDDEPKADPQAGAPLWRVEDALTAAREAAQGDDTPEAREEALARLDRARDLLVTAPTRIDPEADR